MFGTILADSTQKCLPFVSKQSQEFFACVISWKKMIATGFHCSLHYTFSLGNIINLNIGINTKCYLSDITHLRFLSIHSIYEVNAFFAPFVDLSKLKVFLTKNIVKQQKGIISLYKTCDFVKSYTQGVFVKYKESS